MDVTKCDRCGSESTLYAHHVNFYNGWFLGREKLDLCSKCAKKFRKIVRKWIKEED